MLSLQVQFDVFNPSLSLMDCIQDSLGSAFFLFLSASLSFVFLCRLKTSSLASRTRQTACPSEPSRASWLKSPVLLQVRNGEKKQTKMSKTDRQRGSRRCANIKCKSAPVMDSEYLASRDEWKIKGDCGKCWDPRVPGRLKRWHFSLLFPGWFVYGKCFHLTFWK